MAKSRRLTKAKRVSTKRKPAKSVKLTKMEPIAEPPKKRGRKPIEVPDYGDVECPADTRAYEHHIPVKFASGVSSRGRGKEGTRDIGISVKVGDVDKRDADNIFIGTALSACLHASPGTRADAAGQTTFEGSPHVELCAVACCGSLTKGLRKMNVHLRYAKSAVAVDELEKFCGMDGTLHCTVVKSKAKDTE